MRVAFKMLLGLILFHAIFAMYTPIFGTSEEGAISIDDTDNPVTQFNVADLNVGVVLDFIFENALALVGITVIGLVAAIVTRNPVYIGAGIFIGILASLYNTFIQFIFQLGETPTQHNPYVSTILTILSVAIGIIIMYNIVDMFAPHPVQ